MGCNQPTGYMFDIPNFIESYFLSPLGIDKGSLDSQKFISRKSCWSLKCYQICMLLFYCRLTWLPTWNYLWRGEWPKFCECFIQVLSPGILNWYESSFVILWSHAYFHVLNRKLLNFHILHMYANVGGINQSPNPDNSCIKLSGVFYCFPFSLSSREGYSPRKASSIWGLQIGWTLN